MKYLTIILFFTLFACKSVHQTNKQSVENAITNNAVQLLEDKRFHSVSVAVYKDGEATIKHFGELTIGKGNKPNDSTLYELASVTKTFTGYIAAKAVLDKKISLDDDIRIYLDEPYPNFEFKGEPIRIKHLITHTSGFPNFPIKSENKKAFFEGLKLIKIETKPGETYFYSNTAPELTAYILEKVYQKPYEELVNEFILKPNKMNQTKFTLNENDKTRLVKGYNDKNELMPNFNRTLWGGISGLHSTTTDLVKYMKLQLEKSNPVVNESHKKLYKEGSDFWEGYHWYILENDDKLIYRHHGGIYGMQNWFVIYPKQNIGISILTNTSFSETGEILEKVVDKLFDDINK
ncbi:CubicO group peptidase (beta-lactamase class C family) [Flavobacterium cutihirudinis]|uniref:CubicO group peptidase (Beta-lactamase class C family) n=1 Tax=Flavobacterium cutihirudinis TaxID=1265740 RepID=A0A3D9FQ39_9FLAO|nr:serine hydrolase domain-containing protein [Flavobacterium cutihirudinis]RED22502.1 CubicO group peptidase (beta-lactamase class C family) [Flavobacterium cutihirudinis]